MCYVWVFDKVLVVVDVLIENPDASDTTGFNSFVEVAGTQVTFIKFCAKN